MSGLKRALFALGLAGLALGALVFVIVAGSDHEPSKASTLILGPFVGWSFIGVGLVAWWRRPENRVGALMTAVGFTFFLGGLSDANNSTIYGIGVLLGAVWAAVVVQLLLAFPTGRLEGRWPRALVATAYVLVFAIPIGVSLFRDNADNGMPNAPDNPFFVAHNKVIADVIDVGGNLIAIAALIAVTVILFRRWRRATPVQRRSVAPVLVTGALFAVGLAVGSLTDIAGSGSMIVGGPGLVFFLALPYAYLLGLVRSRYSRAGAVSELVVRLQQTGALRDALAEALGDPALRLLYRRSDRGDWVDAAGHAAQLPAAGVTALERDGEAIGAIVHDPALDEDPQLLEAAAGAAALALDNDRLAAELRARVAELQDSRARLIAAGLAERRRLERDLHDGAQQRLVALSLQLGLARGEIERDPATAAHLLDAARDELSQALAELRELARGIHPAVLTDRGLQPALEALADRAPVPVALDELPAERLPVAVEAAAYFVVAESLTNVAKYARAHEAHVRVERRNGAAVVEVRDDGVGGAEPRTGTGLRGLADRLAALDGRLEIHSPPGEGTLVRATIPCAS